MIRALRRLAGNLVIRSAPGEPGEPPEGDDLPASVNIGIGTWYNPIDVFGSPVVSAQSGNWSTGSTWIGGVVPDADDIVQIHHTVTVTGTGNIAEHIVVEDVGTLQWANNGELSVGTLAIAGTVIAGLVGSRISGELMIRDIAPDATNDPDDVWVGIINLDGSQWISWGLTSNAAHHEMADANDTDTTITVTGTITNWVVGDTLYIPGTLRVDNAVAQTGALGQEYRTISSISGQVITLNSGLTYDHLGMSHTAAGAWDNDYNFQPVIQNLSRSFKIYSEDAAGNRGYWICLGRADIGMWYTEVADLTRTVFVNDAGVMAATLGRHCLTFWDYIGPVGGQSNGYSATVKGCSFWADPTTDQYWGPTWFNSHFVLFDDNDINGFYGTGPCLFLATESYNMIDGNRSMNIKGTGNREAFDLSTVNLRGQAGDGFYFRGPINYVVNNVAANCYGTGDNYTYGFIWHQEYLYANENGTHLVPSGPTAVGETPATPVRLTDLPLLQCENNVVFSSTAGLTMWWVNMDMFTFTTNSSATISVVQGLKMWNIFNWGLFQYQATRVTFDDFTFLGGGNAIAPTDYLTEDLLIVNSHIYAPVGAQYYLGHQAGFYAYGNSTNGKTIATVTNSSGNCLVAFNGTHGLSIGHRIKVYDCNVSGYNTSHTITSVPNSTSVITNQSYTSNGTGGDWESAFGSTVITQEIRDTVLANVYALPQYTTQLLSSMQELIAGRCLLLNNVRFVGAVSIYVGPHVGDPTKGVETGADFVEVRDFNGDVGNDFYIQSTHVVRDAAVDEPEATLFGAEQSPITGITGTIYAVA